MGCDEMRSSGSGDGDDLLKDKKQVQKEDKEEEDHSCVTGTIS